MKNSTKFGSLNLDTPRISYEFLKFESISKNQIKKNIKTLKIGTRTRSTAPERQAARTRGQPGPTYHRNKGRDVVLTSESSPTARSPTVRSSPLASPLRSAPNEL